MIDDADSDPDLLLAVLLLSLGMLLEYLVFLEPSCPVVLLCVNGSWSALTILIDALPYYSASFALLWCMQVDESHAFHSEEHSGRRHML